MKFAITLLTASLASPAFAADARHGIDFTQILIGANGEPIQQTGKEGRTELASLGDLALVALLAQTEEDKNLDPRKKYERDQLARKIFKNADAILSPEEIALIKERIGKVYGPGPIGAAWPLLDPTLR